MTNTCVLFLIVLLFLFFERLNKVHCKKIKIMLDNINVLHKEI